MTTKTLESYGTNVTIVPEICTYEALIISIKNYIKLKYKL